jgi:hypothetical protein
MTKRKAESRETNLERKVLKMDTKSDHVPSVTEGRKSRAYLVCTRDIKRVIKFENGIHITILISDTKHGNSSQVQEMVFVYSVYRFVLHHSFLVQKFWSVGSRNLSKSSLSFVHEPLIHRNDR